MDKRQKILIVDDAEFNRVILKEILGETYNYLEAENGNQAIQMIGENIGIDLMLLDINMPQMNGFEVLKIMKRSQCIAETPVIMISSEDAVDTMRKAYELGITDYITRPFDSVIVKKRVQNTLGLYMNQKHLINVVYDQVYEKEENNNIMIRIMSNILGSRNSESREHILHIKTATELMLRQLVKITDAYPMTEVDIALITTASSLHDIGKIRIPEEILNKPGRLTDEEFKIMKKHSELGAAIIKDMDFPQDHRLVHTAWEICRWHHERWDGKGYPDGLKAESISYFARITTISDIYDAMLSARSYKKEKIPFDVLQWFVTEGSKGIDQNLLNIFIKNMVKVYRQQQVIMSDGREGCVEYIPLNDMDHPIVSVGEEVRQVDEDWYCVHMV